MFGVFLFSFSFYFFQFEVFNNSTIASASPDSTFSAATSDVTYLLVLPLENAWSHS